MASEQKLAVESGYFILMRYKDNKLYLDYKNPDFSKYEKIFENEARYSSLKIKNKNEYKILLDKNLADAKEKFDFYKNLTVD